MPSADVRFVARAGWLALRGASPDLLDWYLAPPQDRSAMLRDAALIVEGAAPRHYAGAFPEVLAAMREAASSGRAPAPRPVLVGEFNPYSADPRNALLPNPPRSAGWNLCRLLGLSARQYLETFDRENLCTEEWSLPSAKVTARTIEGRRRGPGAVAVLLGTKVCDAFDRAFRPFSVTPGNLTLVVLPHPSDRSRLWNDPGAAQRAREAVQRAGVDITPEVPDLTELPTTAWTDKRPAACSNCLGLVEGEHCPECDPMGRR